MQKLIELDLTTLNSLDDEDVLAGQAAEDKALMKQWLLTRKQPSPRSQAKKHEALLVDMYINKNLQILTSAKKSLEEVISGLQV